jgi:hypothetical protein
VFDKLILSNVERMPFKYPCFVSYRRGQEALMQRFIEELKRALKAYLEPYFDEDIFIDEEQIQGGDFLDKTLRCALLESVCMILVFTPKYFSKQHTYCAREYQAMRQIEEVRIKSLAKSTHGFIIPIIFRGSEKIPDHLKENGRLYYDFSKYTLVDPGIGDSKEYAAKIDEIAKKIYEISQVLKTPSQDPCISCESFNLPSEDEIKDWLNSVEKVSPEFPGR